MHKIFGLLALLSAYAASPAPPPVEAFGKIPRIENVALARDGNLIAWQQNEAGQTVVVHDLAAGKMKRVLPMPADVKLRDVRWSDSETLLVTASVTRSYQATRKHLDEFYRTLAADVRTGEIRLLLKDEIQYVTGASLLAASTSRPRTVMMSTWTYLASKERQSIGTRFEPGRGGSGWSYSVFAVDTRTGRGSVAEFGSPFTYQWIVDGAGQPIVRGEWEPDTRRSSVLAKDGLGWRAIHRAQGADPLELQELSADGQAVLAIGANGQSTAKLWSIRLDGSGTTALVDDAQRDVIGLVTDEITRHPVAVLLGGAILERVWLDKKAEARHAALARAFRERDVHVRGRSDDHQRVLVQVGSPSHPPMYYLVDFRTGRADIAGEAYPDLAAAKLGQVRPFSYKSRDGAAIPAYITVPSGAEEKNLPLVVLPHGGPEARDYLEFDWWAQFLATRGYLVLQPQFRGSTGFGEAHRRAGYRQWGGLMQDDVTDGVKALIEQQLADPRRICIVGWSYGGYAALAGAAFTPDLYACAVSINGVADLPTMLGYLERERGEDSDAVAYWRDHIGGKFDPNVIEKSPARAAAAIRAPILLLHGADDTVVPATQSEKMARALGAVRKPYTFVTLPGEDHWLSRSETRMRMLAELEQFLAIHLASAPR